MKSSFIGFKGSEPQFPGLLHECVLIFATDPYTHDEETDFRMWCALLFFNVALL